VELGREFWRGGELRRREDRGRDHLGEREREREIRGS